MYKCIRRLYLEVVKDVQRVRAGTTANLVDRHVLVEEGRVEHVLGDRVRVVGREDLHGREPRLLLLLVERRDLAPVVKRAPEVREVDRRRRRVQHLPVLRREVPAVLGVERAVDVLAREHRHVRAVITSSGGGSCRRYAAEVTIDCGWCTRPQHARHAVAQRHRRHSGHSCNQVVGNGEVRWASIDQRNVSENDPVCHSITTIKR